MHNNQLKLSLGEIRIQDGDHFYMSNGIMAERGEIDAQISTMKKEIDALQISFSQGSRPWYRNASTIIAAVAVVITVVFSYDNFHRNIKHDSIRLKDELSSIVIRLHSLPIKRIELISKHKDNPTMQAAIGGTLGAENTVLASRGLEIISKVPEMISVSETLVIALALRNAGKITEAIDLFRMVASNADFNADASAAYRNSGALSFRMGNIDERRKYYSSALEIDKGEASDKSDVMASNINQAQTEMYWAQQEAIVNNCDEWESHMSKAESYVEQINYHPDDLTIKQIKETKSFGCPPIRPALRDPSVDAMIIK